MLFICVNFVLLALAIRLPFCTGVYSKADSRCYDCSYNPQDIVGQDGSSGGMSQSSYRGFRQCALLRREDEQDVGDTPCQSDTCFIRQDHNGLIFRGCADPANLPFGVSSSVNCVKQGVSSAVWWFCEGTLCNSGTFGGGSICSGEQGSYGVGQTVGQAGTKDSQYQQPAPAYNSAPAYQSPPPKYNPVPPTYNPSPPAYNLSPPAYNPSPPAYNPPPPKYNPAPPTYNQPPPKYNPAPPAYNPPPPKYNLSPPAYNPPPPNYNPAPPAYNPPPPKYNSEPPTYNSPSQPYYPAAPKYKPAASTSYTPIPSKYDQAPPVYNPIPPKNEPAEIKYEPVAPKYNPIPSPEYKPNTPPYAPESPKYQPPSPIYPNLGIEYSPPLPSDNQPSGRYSQSVYDGSDTIRASSNDEHIPSLTRYDYNPCDGSCTDSPSRLHAVDSSPEWFIQCGPGTTGTVDCSCCQPFYLRCPPSTTFDALTNVCTNPDEAAHSNNKAV